MACLLAIFVSCRADSFKSISPLLFITTGKFASIGQTEYELRLRWMNPCDLYTNGEAANDTVEVMMYHASKMDCLKLLDETWVSRVKRINSIDYRRPISRSRKPTIPRFDRIRRGIAKARYAEISSIEMDQLGSPKTDSGVERLRAKAMSLLRSRRSFNDYAEAAVEAAAGTVFGFAGSNFVRVQWARLDPNSDRNKIVRAEENIALEYQMLEKLKQETNLTRHVQEQMLSYLSSFAYTLDEQGKKIQEIAQLTPQLGFENGFIQQAIIRNANDLDMIINHFKNHRRVATSELARLLNFTALDDILESDTVMNSISEFNGTITFKFSARNYYATAEVLQVVGLSHFTGLEGEEPMWNTYSGPEYVLYDSATRCAQGLRVKVLPSHIDNTCEQDNFMDTDLNSWTQVRRDPSSSTNRDISVAMDYESHYIYCYPFTIKTDGRLKDCPPWSFDLPNTQAFQIKGRINWTATKRVVNFDQKFLVPLVENFDQRGDSRFDNVTTTNLLKSLAELRELQRANPISHMMPLVTSASNYWIQAAVALLLLLFVVCAFCTFKYLVYLKNYYK